MKRVVIPELLDTDYGTSAEVSASLGDLRRINRWFGGVATTEDMIWGVARNIDSSSLSLLEVAAGTGYVPQTASERLLHRGRPMSVENNLCGGTSRYRTSDARNAVLIGQYSILQIQNSH